MSIFPALKQDISNIEHLFESLINMMYVRERWYKSQDQTHTLVNVILRYNEALPYDNTGKLFLPTSGAYIYKIQEGTARIIASVLMNEVKTTGLPIEFFLAAIQQESCFSPLAFNPNHQHDPTTWQTRTPDNDFRMTDWGAAQFSGMQVPSLLSIRDIILNPADIATLKTHVFDPVWSIEKMARKYKSLVDSVAPLTSTYVDVIESQINASHRSLSTDEVVYFIAWLAYNAGLTGAEKQLKAAHATNSPIGAHPFHCLTWYNQFKGLNITL
jgi:hypothetical protein